MKRIYTFDFFRGIAIIIVPIIHRVIWDYYFQNESPLEGSSIGFFLFSLIMSMAGIFYCISGVVNGYMSYKRVKEGKMTPKQLLLKGVAAGISFILIGLFFRYFMLRSTDDVVSYVIKTGVIRTDNQTGVLPYLILYGKYPTNFENSILFNVGTIQMIGYSVISVSIILAIYFKRNGVHNIRRLRILLFVLAIIIFLSYAIVQPLLGPIAKEAIENDMYFVSFFLSPFVEGIFPLIPHLAFGFFGAFFGLELARDDLQPKKLVKSMRIFWVITMVGGIAFLGILAATVGTSIEMLEMWYYKMARKLFQLGIYFALFLLGLEIFDFQPEEKRKRRIKWTEPIADMGRLTMTIYMFEGIVAVSLQRLISPFWAGWNATIGSTALFGLINLAVWVLIVLVWKQFKFKGSIEHLSVVIVKAISGKESQKLAINSEVRQQG
ncbi:MAG: DUF418 domain-containing protein [Promethearchaeota archaeon]